MPDIRIEHRQALGIVTLDRPDRLNAMDPAMMASLARTMEGVLDDDKVRAVLVTGAGRGFCAGLDLKATAVGEAAPITPGDLLRDILNPMILKMMRGPKPIVAAVNGPAAGVGCALALACDIVIAGRSARFSQAFVRVGAVPDAGTSWILPRLVGLGRAKAMLLLGDTVSADQADRWGLVHQVHDDDRLMSEALALATVLASGPALAYRGIKRLLDAAALASLDAQLQLEAEVQDEVAGTADRQEGVLAFLERRRPRFSGA